MALSPCPRCRSNTVKVRTQSPVAGVWTIFGCDTCFYTWRSTEPPANTDPEHYPQVFRLNPNDLVITAVFMVVAMWIFPEAGVKKGDRGEISRILDHVSFPNRACGYDDRNFKSIALRVYSLVANRSPLRD